MATFWTPLDLPDIGEAVSFFASQSEVDEARWYYHYGLTLTSTRNDGSEGKAGDGDDYILDEGVIEIPERVIKDRDEEYYLYDFAAENVPEVSDELIQEYVDDMDLCEMAYIAAHTPRKMTFTELYFEAVGIEEPDGFDYERAEAVREYADANGWVFEE